ncbi:MAG: hypothetical protein AAB316_13945 [Bacteroidota bacterium]
MNYLPSIHKTNTEDLQQKFPNYKEFLWYKAQESKLLKKYNGKFLVIRDQKIAGVYPSRAEAVDFAYGNFKPGTFIIHHCIPAHQQKVPKLATHQLVTLQDDN